MPSNLDLVKKFFARKSSRSNEDARKEAESFEEKLVEQAAVQDPEVIRGKHTYRTALRAGFTPDQSEFLGRLHFQMLSIAATFGAVLDQTVAEAIAELHIVQQQQLEDLADLGSQVQRGTASNSPGLLGSLAQLGRSLLFGSPAPVSLPATTPALPPIDPELHNAALGIDAIVLSSNLQTLGFTISLDATIVNNDRGGRAILKAPNSTGNLTGIEHNLFTINYRDQWSARPFVEAYIEQDSQGISFPPFGASVHGKNGGSTTAVTLASDVITTQAWTANQEFPVRWRIG